MSKADRAGNMCSICGFHISATVPGFSSFPSESKQVGHTRGDHRGRRQSGDVEQLCFLVPGSRSAKIVCNTQGMCKEILDRDRPPRFRTFADAIENRIIELQSALVTKDHSSPGTRFLKA